MKTAPNLRTGGRYHERVRILFSLFGLILGLAIATIAGGMSDVLRERTRIPIGWLTPLTATFLLIDLTSFWVVSWQSLSEIRIGFPSMLSVVSLAVVYVFAAGMVLPKKVEEWASIDEYYLQHYRWCSAACCSRISAC